MKYITIILCSSALFACAGENLSEIRANNNATYNAYCGVENISSVRQKICDKIKEKGLAVRGKTDEAKELIEELQKASE